MDKRIVSAFEYALNYEICVVFSCIHTYLDCGFESHLDLSMYKIQMVFIVVLKMCYVNWDIFDLPAPALLFVLKLHVALLSQNH
jgi:hypothetical protein